jgi:uncharacterized protein (DUF2267 family)
MKDIWLETWFQLEDEHAPIFNDVTEIARRIWGEHNVTKERYNAVRNALERHVTQGTFDRTEVSGANVRVLYYSRQRLHDFLNKDQNYS